VSNEKLIGFDLVHFVPDYKKTLDENWEEYRKKYFEVYGEFPPEPKKNELQ
jgi:hypothetical protein